MTSWHLDQLDKLDDEFDFIKATADSLQVAADGDDSVQPQSLSTMMLRIFDSAERCKTLVNEFRLPPSQIPSLSENPETETGNGEAVDVHDAGDDQDEPEYDHLEGDRVFRESIGHVKGLFDMLEVSHEHKDCLYDDTVEDLARAGYKAAKVAEQQYEALETDYMSNRKQLREIETTE